MLLHNLWILPRREVFNQAYETASSALRNAKSFATDKAIPWFESKLSNFNNSSSVSRVKEWYER